MFAERPSPFPESVSDPELAALVRAGNRDAFGELWHRHADAALVVARQYRSIADPQDIVQEASRRILNAMCEGGGPIGDFRPYLNQTVRNVAVSWSRSRRTDPVGDAHDFADQGFAAHAPDHVDGALERMITVRAFKSLPLRWQTVLWYTYVEGLGSDEAAERLGLSRNAASALVSRAREGLRQAWLKAHVADDGLPIECRQVVSHLPALERGEISPRNRERVSEHLNRCARCSIIAAEVSDLATRLPIVLLPMVVAGFDVLGSSLDELLHGPPTVPADPVSTVPVPLDPGASPVPGMKSGHLRSFGGAKAAAAGGLVVSAGVLAFIMVLNASSHSNAGITGPDSVVASAENSSAEEGGSLSAAPSEAASPSSEATPQQPTATPSARQTVKELPPQAEQSIQETSNTADPSLQTPQDGPEALPPAAPRPPQVGDVGPLGNVPPPEVMVLPPAGNVLWLGDDFVFAGNAVPGATVELVEGVDVLHTTVVGQDGTWAMQPAITLSQYDNVKELSLRQVATDGRVSGVVGGQEYIFHAPAIGVATPFQGKTLLQITGLPGLGVSIESQGQIKTMTLDALGHASVEFHGATPGTRQFTVSYTNGVQRGAKISITKIIN